MLTTRDRLIPSTFRSVILSLIVSVCGVLGTTAHGQATAPATAQQTPPAAAPAAPPATFLTPPLPPITVLMTANDVDPQFQKLAVQFAQVPVPVQFDPVTLQTVLSSPPDVLTNPADATPLAHAMRSAYQQVSALRPDQELTWKSGIDPMFWVPRSKGGAADWWRAFRGLPVAQRPPVVTMFPFAYDTDTYTSPAARVRARDITNQGVDALIGAGDTARAGELFGRAVTADPTYAQAAYNQGLFQMIQNNFQPAYKWMKNAQKLGLNATYAPYAESFLANLNQLTVLLLMDHGSQRHIYDDLIDAAWAMASVNQPYAATILAGQASVLDRDEERPEAAVLAALLCARQGHAADAQRFLQIALERCKSASAQKIVLAGLHEAMAAANAAATP